MSLTIIWLIKDLLSIDLIIVLYMQFTIYLHMYLIILITAKFALTIESTSGYHKMVVGHAYNT